MICPFHHLDLSWVLCIEMWMDLESVIQSKISRKRKQALSINAFMWNLEKMGQLNLFAGQE